MRTQAPFVLFLAFLTLSGCNSTPIGVKVDRPESPEQLSALAARKVGINGRLLYVTAHPDDEDNAVLAYFAHGQGYRVTLLTLTHGEGGQNEIGPEQDEALAALRMEELREAHRYDGAEQRFSRAIDFGYSFSEEETLAKWGAEEITRDIVQVIRETRPQVILTMPTKAEGGGRHHQASAALARRAYDVAATNQWPELGPPWAVARILEQAWDAKDDELNLYEVPVQEYDPVLKTTYARLGFVARSMHKCQGTPQFMDPKAKPRRSRFRYVASRLKWANSGGNLFDNLDMFPTDDVRASGPTHAPPASVLVFERESGDLERFRTAPLSLPRTGIDNLPGIQSGYGGGEVSTMVEYPHINRVFLKEPVWVGDARRKRAQSPIPATGVRVGLIAEAKDELEGVLRDFGIHVTALRDLSGALPVQPFSDFDVIIVGQRAYKIRKDLPPRHTELMEWAAKGGRLIVLYQRPDEFNTGKGDDARSPFTPYPARVGAGRTTDESAPPFLLKPEHRFFNTPNRLASEDWWGWFQERGLYYLVPLDSQYLDLIQFEDPFPANAGKKGGALVTCAVGKGSWTYVGLSLQRQLRHAVPGAGRLLANLLKATP